MRILLVTQSPADAANEPESPAASLRDLGCDVVACNFDLALDEERLAKQPPSVLVIDARERLETAYGCLKALRERLPLQQTPSLIAVTVQRLPSLDYRAADDFFLVPVVPAELYARLRQLDYRFAAFKDEERLKVGDLTLDLAGYEAHLRDRKL
jgi:DNA-binding response OmpR family regulator